MLWSGDRRAAVLVASGQLVVVAVLLVLRQAVSGAGRVGDVVLVMTRAIQVNQQIGAALQLLQQLQRMARSLTRLRWMRALIRSQQPTGADLTVPDLLRHGIELRGLEFTYPGTEKPVMTDVGLLLLAGATVAVVGENGAGKTTLVKLLCRFYEATAGEIMVDSIDIRRFPLDGWRRRIAAGFQDVVRFELRARETVGIDELTSELDAEADHALFERYAANARRVGRRTGAIIILVLRRFSTVRMADLIVVMDGGRLVEAGNHAQLIAPNGVYAELYSLQAAA
ncbi:ATP-binding cassette domain-containing protein [Paractinoplanes hotanensis]|uniref:ABC transporter ATP-binding protein n=1 Tax=Paractinoplanes hotanensis TaxID=2906497 RepID=A0ABT0YBU6_9ACTN|nr:ABC transporter ATP-binding protein [Actinoplanes hotanensis]MCM4083541.1 ABC transporter ATP-binding protein [Actinoplanes hotanensis]